MTDVQANDGPMRVLMIGMGDEILAIEAGIVREIIDPVPVTRVVGAKSFLPGVVNVRGNIIPLADLRIRFGMPCNANSGDTRIVVVEMTVDDDPVIVGIVADKVYEVAELATASAQPTPRVGLRWSPDFIRFIAKWNNEFIIVPDMTRIFN